MVLTVNGNGKRSELRRYDEFLVNNDTAQTQTATLRLPNKISGGDAYTWFQIHGVDSPFLRVTHVADMGGHTDYLFASLNAGPSDGATNVDDSSGTRQYALTPHITEDISVAVMCEKGILTVYINGKKLLEVDVSDWNGNNYFNAGAYVQYMSAPCYVEFREFGYPETVAGGTAAASQPEMMTAGATATAAPATTGTPAATTLAVTDVPATRKRDSATTSAQGSDEMESHDGCK